MIHVVYFLPYDHVTTTHEVVVSKQYIYELIARPSMKAWLRPIALPPSPKVSLDSFFLSFFGVHYLAFIAKSMVTRHSQTSRNIIASPLPRKELGLLLASRGGVYPVTLYLPPLTYFTLK